MPARKPRPYGGGRYTEADCFGYESSYTVRSDGRIFSKERKVNHVYGCRRVKSREMRQYIGNHGYPVVYLSQNNNDRVCTVHRLVLLSFMGLPNQGQEARHLDGDKSNCCLSNLKWGTPKENRLDQKIHGTEARGEKSPLSKLKESDVISIRELISRGLRQKDIASMFGLTQQGISDIKNGRAWAWLEN